MNKKEYKKPSMKVIELDSNDIICGSPGDPSRMSLYEEHIDENQAPSDERSIIWGIQW